MATAGRVRFAYLDIPDGSAGEEVTMDEPIKNYPEYPVTLRSVSVMALLLALAGGVSLAIYRAVDTGAPKRAGPRAEPAIQRTDSDIGAAKRFERVPRAPDQIGAR
jgi:hypothetical protein